MSASITAVREDWSDCELDENDKPTDKTPSHTDDRLESGSGVRSPAPKVFSASPSAAEKRAMRIGKRKASRWLRAQILESKLERAIMQRDLEKREHEKTKLQMAQKLAAMELRALKAETMEQLAIRHALELKKAAAERKRRIELGRRAMKLVRLLATDFATQVAIGYFGGKVMRMVDAQLARAVRALIRR